MLLLAAVGLIALLLVGPRLVGAYVNWLWFGEVGFRSVALENVGRIKLLDEKLDAELRQAGDLQPSPCLASARFTGPVARSPAPERTPGTW